MNETRVGYAITTESAAGLTPFRAAELGVLVIPSEYRVRGADICVDDGTERAAVEVRTALQRNRTVTVAFPGAARFEAFFAPLVERGTDVLHLSASGALSGAYRCARMQAEALQARFPERRVHVLDTRAVCGGLALLVERAAQLRAEGKPLDACRAALEAERLRVQHLFSVGSVALLIQRALLPREQTGVYPPLTRPVLTLDAEGRLRQLPGALGGRAALRTLAERFVRTVADAENARVDIAYAGTAREAALLTELLQSKKPRLQVSSGQLAAVLCACTGPDAIWLCYWGQGRY